MKKQKNIPESFEGMMKRLEEIVESLESGSVQLDDSLKLYEEGIQLSKLCVDKLKASELKIKQLSKNIDGSFELFDASK